MAIEIEKKYRLTVQDRESVQIELKECGAVFVRREFEENIIYSGPTLRENGAIIRIRKIGERTILTYKRRVENNFDVKQQIEHETVVANAEAMESIIAELGLTPALIYEKYRDTWTFRSVEVVIDELPFGLFMEIEGSITAIKEAEIFLGIEELETVHETYPRLTAEFGVRNGEVIEARYDNG
ncbi:MAG TPA: class IV adenylate cyclase [Pyrinomonadaceae bacterium]|nr:class IV adenylate cyclase [Pyrinomonadaceae bacterium]